MNVSRVPFRSIEVLSIVHNLLRDRVLQGRTRYLADIISLSIEYLNETLVALLVYYNPMKLVMSAYIGVRTNFKLPAQLCKIIREERILRITSGSCNSR